MPPGFNPTGVLTLELTMSGRKYTDVPKMQETVRELWTRLARVPGAAAVGSISALPLSNMMAWGPITVEGRAAVPNERFINVADRARRRRLLPAMEIPLRAGRLFNAEDIRTAPRVGIIDDRMSKTLWPDGDAIGKRIRTGGIDDNNTAPWITIVGIVGAIKQDALDSASRMALYFPHMQLPDAR